jgi:RNA polymerase sigma-70 factor (ECF subfamily)
MEGLAFVRKREANGFPSHLMFPIFRIGPSNHQREFHMAQRLTDLSAAEIMRIHNWILTTALRIVGEYEDAEDVVQDRFLKALEVGELDSILNWMYVAVRRRCIDVMLRRRQRIRRLGRRIDLAHVSLARNHFREIESRELDEEVLAALSELPDRERVVLMRRVQGRTFMEIASEFGVCESTARKAYQNARRHVRQAFENRR